MLGRRLERAQASRLGAARRHLDALARVLDGVSYRGALERGFALVRGTDGTIKRRAEQVVSGEALSLTFADGEVGAVAAGSAPKSKARGKTTAGQGDLF